jgi:peptidoglycan/LPS O-acetylase OafA/YrhL
MHPNPAITKPHYPILDGLRGVAAIMVVIFHLCEAHATSHLDQVINHGYLAVDFFFLLSGFVIGYAYDDRWTTMSVGDFFKRRLVRLHPLVVLGSVIGAICYYFSASALFPIISSVPVWQVVVTMVIGFTLIPLPPSMDIRGWDEMHPLDGPAWSLFFEYFANLLYALFVRKFSTFALSVLVFLSACLLLHLAVTSPKGDVIGGWSVTPQQLHVGIARTMYPFFAGLLLFRVAKLTVFRNAFLLSSLLVIAVLATPRIGGAANLWMNGLYDALCIILLFPLIVYIGASGDVKGKFASRLCKILGDISYPIYITHYPIIYIYTAWAFDNKIPLRNAFPIASLTFVAILLLAYASLKLYDEPVRLWLKKKVLFKEV